ncbi:MAG: hypothetical protein ACRDRS_24040 [Pseudonocardiaceae bacterium]
MPRSLERHAEPASEPGQGVGGTPVGLGEQVDSLVDLGAVGGSAVGRCGGPVERVEGLGPAAVEGSRAGDVDPVAARAGNGGGAVRELDGHRHPVHGDIDLRRDHVVVGGSPESYVRPAPELR